MIELWKLQKCARKCTLLVYVKIFIHQTPCSGLLLMTSFPSPDPEATSCAKPCGSSFVRVSPLLKLVQVSLDDIPFVCCINCTTQIGVISKLAECALNFTIQFMMKMLKSTQSQDPWMSPVVICLHLDTETSLQTPLHHK